ncbi:MAG: DNA helicase [Rhodospirillales bacterium RIFCSPLOWO2_12_FULL_58_28]|nr:MAG: DNA helicase [Rhodospirillales bacterium RIFCSPLOWO2_02_FULL_58_16]OHC78159.1 MAG: DNA helicase [Rhodospirillales bacterium RIFCSPLOWO2_12_FULL_58_28]
MKFSDLGLGDKVLRAVADAGYTEPTPIQAQAIPVILMGRDIMGCAQTGTGKTASFTLPMIDILAAGKAKARMPRTLILEPTRELAAQVADNFEVYGKHQKLSMALIIGGTSMNDQIAVIDRGPDVLIATPGRLLDLFDRGRLLLNDVKILVIDEADRMLDMGFIPDVERIVSLVPKIRQTLFFSATMAPEIRRLAEAFLMNPKEISVSPPASVTAMVTQGLVMVAHGDGKRPGGGQKEKRAALRQLIKNETVKNALVFCNRKRDVSVLCKSLIRHGYNAAQLHGDMAQASRMEVLDNFKNDKITFLVCSDVAARGLDVPNMSHVFNFDVPTHAEDYVHRIGRTGRARKEGRALTLATPEDGKYLAAIAGIIGHEIPRIELTGVQSAEPEAASDRPHAGRERGRERGRGRKQETRRPEIKETPPKPIEAKKETAKKPEREREPSNKPTFGAGVHTPAFLLRPAKPNE